MQDSKIHKIHEILNNLELRPLHSVLCIVTLTNQNVLKHIRTTVTNNEKVIDKIENWPELCFLEGLNIKWKKPSLNTGIKATKELVLFS